MNKILTYLVWKSPWLIAAILLTNPKKPWQLWAAGEQLHPSQPWNPQPQVAYDLQIMNMLNENIMQLNLNVHEIFESLLVDER